MKLTDNEIRDIIKHMEAGKDLPEKYRFLLFEDKREVELVWNGKTGDVCNVVLPFQVIEQTGPVVLSLPTPRGPCGVPSYFIGIDRSPARHRPTGKASDSTNTVSPDPSPGRA